eukprot:gnl/TRDRNA2_/TRDRNA2_172120_c0_seq1.p1 gnl/TRDRNA2_/TRDRNA2_172120_c0~~gnl/TRDRNA2_/TRDRNA2_172120_c0_seq1.p1  ORF type:complete len:409 (+),score=37.19 gnl/TRDRNA2_/TRDRNA2_172120_c0_seq1:71-1228(+)
MRRGVGRVGTLIRGSCRARRLADCRLPARRAAAAPKIEPWEAEQTCSGSCGINILEARSYPHHPVMLRIPRIGHPVSREFIVDHGGLRVPTIFDCENLCNATEWELGICPWGGDFRYFFSVPARMHACHMHEAYLKSHVRLRTPELPLIDEEYSEHVAVFHAVLRARRYFVAAELGARWGTWGARAVSLLRQANPMPYDVLFVEAHRPYCAGLTTVMKVNAINYTLSCKRVSPAVFLRWAMQVPHIDLVNSDIQGFERNFFENADVQRVLNAKAYRLVIATHGVDVHRIVREVFKNWISIQDVPQQHHVWCVRRYLQGDDDQDSPNRLNWQELIKYGCFHASPWGKIVHWDGLLILDNPRFVDEWRHFTLHDTSLILDDLRPDYI